MFLHHIPQNLIGDFLNLAYTLIASDGIITDEEKKDFDLYGVELNLSVMPECQIVDYEQALDTFLDMPKAVQREIYFELVALSYADSDFEAREEEVLRKVQNKFNISDQDAQEIKHIVVTIVQQYDQLGKIING